MMPGIAADGGPRGAGAPPTARAVDGPPPEGAVAAFWGQFAQFLMTPAPLPSPAPEHGAPAGATPTLPSAGAPVLTTPAITLQPTAAAGAIAVSVPARPAAAMHSRGQHQGQAPLEVMPGAGMPDGWQQGEATSAAWRTHMQEGLASPRPESSAATLAGATGDVAQQATPTGDITSLARSTPGLSTVHRLEMPAAVADLPDASSRIESAPTLRQEIPAAVADLPDPPAPRQQGGTLQPAAGLQPRQASEVRLLPTATANGGPIAPLDPAGATPVASGPGLMEAGPLLDRTDPSSRPASDGRDPVREGPPLASANPAPATAGARPAEAAGGAALPPTPTPVQIAREVVLRLRQGHTSMRIQLEPAALGRVDCQIAMVNGQVTVRLTAEHAEARQAIESGLPELRAALEQRGITPDRFMVETSGLMAQSGWAQQNGRRERPPARAALPPSGRPGPEEGASVPAAARPALRPLSGVDYRV